MVTSRSFPQQTAQIFSALAGQKRSALRFSQMGQDTKSPQCAKTVQQNTLRNSKRQKPRSTPILTVVRSAKLPWPHVRLRHNHFVAEASRRDGQQGGPENAKRQAVRPKMNQARAAQDDAARDVDEIGRGNEIAEGIKHRRYRLAGKDIAREKDAGKNGKKRQLHGFRLRRSFARNQDSQR